MRNHNELILPLHGQTVARPGRDRMEQGCALGCKNSACLAPVAGGDAPCTAYLPNTNRVHDQYTPLAPTLSSRHAPPGGDPADKGVRVPAPPPSARRRYALTL